MHWRDILVCRQNFFHDIITRVCLAAHIGYWFLLVSSRTQYINQFHVNDFVEWRFSIFSTRTAHSRVATHEKCFLHRKSLSSVRSEWRTTDCTPKNSFIWLSDRPKMKQHTISSVAVPTAPSCHQVEHLLRFHSWMPKYLVMLTQNWKLRVTCNNLLCTEN